MAGGKVQGRTTVATNIVQKAKAILMWLAL